MSVYRFKNQAEAVKWLEQHFGVFLEANDQKGKWAAYVPHETSENGMAIGYGNTVPEAVDNVANLIE